VETEQHRKDRVEGLYKELRKAYKEQAEAIDYSQPEYNDGARLADFRKSLFLTQGELAIIADVDQQLISVMETKSKFFEPSRSKTWKAIFQLQGEQQIAEIKANPPKSTFDVMQWMGAFKTPLERKDEEIELLKKERDNAREQLRLTKQLLDMDLLNRCCELEKQLAEARQQLADYGRLFNLKGATVAGDELQEQIEQRTKREE
jgi:DNA-binding XRE family transcriptional regulator